MTPLERRKPEVLKASRKRRIAAGAGVQVQEVNRLLTQFEQMQKMMKMMRGGRSQDAAEHEGHAARHAMSATSRASSSFACLVAAVSRPCRANGAQSRTPERSRPTASWSRSAPSILTATTPPRRASVAKRLLDAGFDPAGRGGARAQAAQGQPASRACAAAGGAKPLLLLAHLDVVEAPSAPTGRRLDPFMLHEKDGYYYGRGTSTTRRWPSIFIANLLRMKQEGYRARPRHHPRAHRRRGERRAQRRRWLVQNHRDLIDAAYRAERGRRRHACATASRSSTRSRRARRCYQTSRSRRRIAAATVAAARRTTPSTSSPPRCDASAATSSPSQLNDVTRAFFDADRADGDAARWRARCARSSAERRGPKRGGDGSRAAPRYNAHAAHDLRGDAARGRPRRQRAAAARRRERQLPPDSRRGSGSSSPPSSSGHRRRARGREGPWQGSRRATPSDPQARHHGHDPPHLRVDVAGRARGAHAWARVRPTAPGFATSVSPFMACPGFSSSTARSRAHGRDERLGVRALARGQRVPLPPGAGARSRIVALQM